MPATRDSHSVEQPSDRADLVLEARVGPRDEFAFVTADGLRSPKSFHTTELHLLDVLADDPPDSVLVPEANYGVVGVVMGALGADVRMTERSARAARLCRINTSKNGVARRAATAIAADPGQLPGRFEAAALAPAPYEPCAVVEQRIADSLRVLEPGGELYLAAQTNGGASRYRRTLDEHGVETSIVDDRDDCLVIRGRRPVDFDPPRYAELRTLTPTIDGTTLELVSYPGLFAASGLDDGTRALAEHIEVEDGERVLDLACGYGPLGVYAASTADCEVTFTDDDRMATVCARRSALRSGVSSVAVETADGVAAVRDREFDRVVCNPPTHAGAGVVLSLVRGALEVLAPDGRVHLVHHAGIEFDRYVEPSFDRFESVERGAYRIVTAWQ